MSVSLWILAVAITFSCKCCHLFLPENPVDLQVCFSNACMYFKTFFLLFDFNLSFEVDIILVSCVYTMSIFFFLHKIEYSRSLSLANHFWNAVNVKSCHWSLDFVKCFAWALVLDSFQCVWFLEDCGVVLDLGRILDVQWLVLANPQWIKYNTLLKLRSHLLRIQICQEFLISNLE